MVEIKKYITQLKAGAAFINITPKEPHFLFGYPFVKRTSTGVHDWLLSSALYLTDGLEQVIFIANDVIYVSKASVSRIRAAISEKTGVSPDHILIGATHTHSGPVTVDCVMNTNDPIVPKADPKYLAYMENGIIRAACNAYEQASPAEIGFMVADGTGIGTNRHDPSGPSDMEIPVLVVRNMDKEFIACMLVCNMHPTVLHEDSMLYSGDFPAYTREIIQKTYLRSECPVLYFTGAAGNQSPRHVTQNNTFEEAHRIGGILALAVGAKLLDEMSYFSEISVSCLQNFIDLPKRQVPSVEWADQHQKKAREHFEILRKTSKNQQEIRTAEVDWFGSEELLHLSILAESNALEETYKKCLPAEIQIIKIGDWSFVSWPGEIFVEYALELKRRFDQTFLITLTNGELQGYIATEEATLKGFYEASNSIFDFSAGAVLVEKTSQYLENLK
jgi:neutral ceramidase